MLAYLRSNSKLLPRLGRRISWRARRRSRRSRAEYARVGAGAGPTFPTALTVRLARAVSTPTTVAITAGAGLTVSDVVIPAGTASAVVPVTGVAASATPVTVTATLNGVSRMGSVRVLGATEAARIASLTPAMATLSIGATGTFRVGLDIPAPPGGSTVTLSLSAGGSVPATVTVPENTLGADVTVTAGATDAMGTLTATLGGDMRTATVTVVSAPPGHLVINEVDYDQVGSDTGEFVELYNAGLTPVNLSTLALVMVNGSNSREYGRVMLSGTLAPGAYAVAANTSVTVPAGTMRFAIGTDALQNGAPDGVALIDTATGTLVDALSYEGPMAAATITGIMGTVSLVEGTVLATTVADSNMTAGSLCRLPNGSDTDDADTDWRFSTTITPGAPNVP
ncbi:MAG: lamin tail domain-containing protein [Polyangiales bacterium]